MCGQQPGSGLLRNAHIHPYYAIRITQRADAPMAELPAATSVSSGVSRPRRHVTRRAAGSRPDEDEPARVAAKRLFT